MFFGVTFNSKGLYERRLPHQIPERQHWKKLLTKCFGNDQNIGCYELECTYGDDTFHQKSPKSSVTI